MFNFSFSFFDLVPSGRAMWYTGMMLEKSTSYSSSTSSGSRGKKRRLARGGRGAQLAAKAIDRCSAKCQIHRICPRENKRGDKRWETQLKVGRVFETDDGPTDDGGWVLSFQVVHSEQDGRRKTKDGGESNSWVY